MVGSSQDDKLAEVMTDKEMDHFKNLTKWSKMCELLFCLPLQVAAGEIPVRILPVFVRGGGTTTLSQSEQILF